MYVCMYVYVIGHSPLGLFRTNVGTVTDCASDHNLVIAKTLLKLNRTGRRAVQVRRYQTSKLNVPEIR